MTPVLSFDDANPVGTNNDSTSSVSLNIERRNDRMMASGAASTQVRAAAQVLFDTKHFLKDYGGIAAPPGWDGALRHVLKHLGSY